MQHQEFDERLYERMKASIFNYDKDVKIKKTEWLYDNWIPRGTVTIVSGKGGLGKGYIVMDIIGRLANAKELIYHDDLEHESKDPINCSFITLEDDPETTVKKRLEYDLGHDTKNIYGINAVALPTMHIEKPEVQQLLLGHVKEHDIKLLVIDPIISMCGVSDDNNHVKVRSSMNHFYKMAKELNIAIIGIHHNRKSANTFNASADDVMGSNAWVNQSRHVISFDKVRTDDNEATDWRRYKVSKSNLGSDSSRLAIEYMITKEGSVEYREGVFPMQKTTKQKVAEAIEQIMEQSEKLDSKQLDEHLKQRQFTPNAIEHGKRYARAHSIVKTNLNKPTQGAVQYEFIPIADRVDETEEESSGRGDETRVENSVSDFDNDFSEALKVEGQNAN